MKEKVASIAGELKKQAQVHLPIKASADGECSFWQERVDAG